MHNHLIIWSFCEDFRQTQLSIFSKPRRFKSSKANLDGWYPFSPLCTESRIVVSETYIYMYMSLVGKDVIRRDLTLIKN